MIQSTWETAGAHVAIIMDGNGRWAERQHLPRLAGHRTGAEAIRRVVESAPGHGISVLTLFAFSEENWHRPGPEVEGLMGLFDHFLRTEVDHALAAGVRINVIGRRDRLTPALLASIDRAELATRESTRLLVRIGIDYSARGALWRTAGSTVATRRQFGERLGQVIHSIRGVGDVDLLIRTGGERRLSDFLLYEAAWAELYFTDCMWPAFGSAELRQAMEDFRARERRFGRLPVPSTLTAR